MFSRDSTPRAGPITELQCYKSSGEWQHPSTYNSVRKLVCMISGTRRKTQRSTDSWNPFTFFFLLFISTFSLLCFSVLEWFIHLSDTFIAYIFPNTWAALHWFSNVVWWTEVFNFNKVQCINSFHMVSAFSIF